MALVLDREHGGRVLFNMTVDPDQQNHLTIKYWGGISYVNGTAFVKQVRNPGM